MNGLIFMVYWLLGRYTPYMDFMVLALPVAQAKETTECVYGHFIEDAINEYGAICKISLDLASIGLEVLQQCHIGTLNTLDH